MNNDKILTEAFWNRSKKKTLADKLADVTYEPVDKLQQGQPGYTSILDPSQGAFVVTNPDEAKRRLVSSFGALVGNNTIKTMAQKSIKTFPIIVSDNVEPETAVMLKRITEEQYAEYISLYISNTMIDANAFLTGNKDGNVAIQALDMIDGDDFSKRQGFATKTRNGDFGSAADVLTKNSMIRNFLQQESSELDTGDEFGNALLEGAAIIPTELDDAFMEYMHENMDLILESYGVSPANQGRRRQLAEERHAAMSAKISEALKSKKSEATVGVSLKETLSELSAATNSKKFVESIDESATKLKANLNEDKAEFVDLLQTMAVINPKSAKALNEGWADADRSFTGLLDVMTLDPNNRRVSNVARTAGTLTQQDLDNINDALANYESESFRKFEYIGNQISTIADVFKGPAKNPAEANNTLRAARNFIDSASEAIATKINQCNLLSNFVEILKGFSDPRDGRMYNGMINNIERIIRNASTLLSSFIMQIAFCEIKQIGYACVWGSPISNRIERDWSFLKVVAEKLETACSINRSDIYGTSRGFNYKMRSYGLVHNLDTAIVSHIFEDMVISNRLPAGADMGARLDGWVDSQGCTENDARNLLRNYKYIDINKFADSTDKTAMKVLAWAIHDCKIEDLHNSYDFVTEFFGQINIREYTNALTKNIQSGSMGSSRSPYSNWNVNQSSRYGDSYDRRSQEAVPTSPREMFGRSGRQSAQPPAVMSSSPVDTRDFLKNLDNILNRYCETVNNDRSRNPVAAGQATVNEVFKNNQSFVDDLKSMVFSSFGNGSIDARVDSAMPLLYCDANEDPRSTISLMNDKSFSNGIDWIYFKYDISFYQNIDNNPMFKACEEYFKQIKQIDSKIDDMYRESNTALSNAELAMRNEDNTKLVSAKDTIITNAALATPLFTQMKIMSDNLKDICGWFEANASNKYSGTGKYGYTSNEYTAIEHAQKIVKNVKDKIFEINNKINASVASGAYNDSSKALAFLDYRLNVAYNEEKTGQAAYRFYNSIITILNNYIKTVDGYIQAAQTKISKLGKNYEETNEFIFAPTERLSSYMNQLVQNKGERERSNNGRGEDGSNIHFLNPHDIKDMGSKVMSTGNMDTTELVVNKNIMDKVIERRVMDILNDPNNIELRNWYEEATFLLQARKITGREYISYVTERLGLPMTDAARRELTLRFKDVPFAENMRESLGLMTDKELKAAGEDPKSNSIIRKYCIETANTKMGKALLVSGVASGLVGAAGLTAGIILATNPIGWALLGAGAIGGAITGIVAAIKRKKKNKAQSILKIKRGDWRIVEKMIKIIEQQRRDVKTAYKEATLVNPNAGQWDQFVSSNGIASEKALNDAILRAKQTIALTEEDLAEYNSIAHNETFFESSNSLNEEILNEEMEMFNEAVAEDSELAQMVTLNEAVISTTTPVKLVQKYTYDTKSKPEVMVTPEYGVRANKAYGSVEYDKRELKDRRYNSPLMLTVKFKQRYSDGTFADNEMSAVIGILGVITRVPSEEMKEILRSNIKDVTLHGILAPDDKKDSSSIINLFANIKKNPKLEVSSELWDNLSKMSKMAFVNRLAGRQNNNIANAHIIFSQKEIDDVKAETNVDYLRDKKSVAKLMKRYNAFAIMVTNDIAERLYVFDDLDNINWNVVPYSALRPANNSNDQMISAIQKLRNL